MTGTWQLQTPSNVGVRTDYETVSGRDDFCCTEYFAGWNYANLMTLAPDEDTYAIGGGLSAFALSFDVVANHPALLIDRIGAFAPNGFNLGLVEAWTYVTIPTATVEVTAFPHEVGGHIQTTMTAPGTLLDTLHVAPIWENLPAAYEDSVIFSPLKRVTVHSFILVRPENPTFGSSYFGALAHEVRLALVPEPASWIMLIGLVAVGLIWRREI
jgi:hypothetical protein